MTETQTRTFTPVNYGPVLVKRLEMLQEDLAKFNDIAAKFDLDQIQITGIPQIPGELFLKLGGPQFEAPKAGDIVCLHPRFGGTGAALELVRVENGIAHLRGPGGEASVAVASQLVLASDYPAAVRRAEALKKASETRRAKKNG